MVPDDDGILSEIWFASIEEKLVTWFFLEQHISGVHAGIGQPYWWLLYAQDTENLGLGKVEGKGKLGLQDFCVRDVSVWKKPLSTIKL